MSTEIKEIEIAVEHPMEEILDIEEGTTIIPRTERTTALVVTEEYDTKDNEIEGQMKKYTMLQWAHLNLS